MKGRFDLWPKVFVDEPMPWPCAICQFVCGERGYVEIEGVHIRVCQCCIELIVTAAPDIARGTLASTTQGEPK
jgi:hypothetical protein